MLTISAIVANIKKGQQALKVREILAKLERSYQQLKSNIAVTGCKKEATKVTVYLTAPSSSTPGVIYDIVLELHTAKKLSVNTQFKVYTNSPAFAYSFCYVFNQQGSLLFPEKYPRQFKELSPRTRNPFLFVGFDKLVFSAIRFVSEYGLSRIVGEYNGIEPPVKSFEEKIREIKDVQDEIARGQAAPSD